MIRHSSSFLISFTFHLILFLVLFFSFKSIAHEAQKEEKMVCVKLCSVAYEEKSEKSVPHAELKITPQKIEKKVIQKPKETVKKIEITQKVPTHQKFPQELPPETTSTVAIAQVTEQVHLPTPDEQKRKNMKKLEEDYLEEHLQKIVKLLQENLYYPRSARERGVIGEVIIKFMLKDNGEVQSVEIISSKSETLSNAAIKTIENLSGSFPKPTENLLLQLPINYSLK